MLYVYYNCEKAIEIFIYYSRNRNKNVEIKKIAVFLDFIKHIK